MPGILKSQHLTELREVNANLSVASQSQPLPRRAFFLAGKRAFDIIVSLIVSVFFLSWAVPVIALLIKIDSRGPVFFRQRRIGFMGKSFVCLKFRTMVVNEYCDTQQAKENDPRVTPLGRFLRRTSLDELPQFFNVLAGHMSIVGPRPFMPRDNDSFRKMVPNYDLRFYAKPGITGMAQVKGMRGPLADFQGIFHRYQWDAFYVRNACPSLDLKIMRLTSAMMVESVVNYHKTFRKAKVQRGKIRSINNRENFLGLGIDTLSLTETLEKVMDWGVRRVPSYVCFLNVHMLVETRQDSDFRRQVNNATLVLPDGMPIVKSVEYFYGKKQERKAGMDFIERILEEANIVSASVFLYGCSDEIQEKMAARIRRDYPSVRLAGRISPAFRPLSKAESDDHIRQINESGANVVMVSLGCPKQEKWMAEHSSRISGVCLGLGGAFPIFAGVQTRAPQWMQRNSLEWLYRLVQEPRRMFRRYVYTNTYFLLLLTRKFLAH